MPSEDTPLLSEAGLKHESVYNRFSKQRKRVLVVLVALCGVFPLFVAGTFLPAIPQVVKEFDSTASIVSLAVSLSIFAACLGGLSGATYSTFYGRRVVYLFSLPLLFIGSVGVALAQSIPQLMFWRFIQAFGAAPGLSVGAGVIGDIYKLEERGQSMGIFFAACLVGPALAPPIGGFAVRYLSWRVMQLIIAFFGIMIYLAMLILFPETSHPGMRGIDKRRKKDPDARRSNIIFINPFRPLWLLRSPNLLAVSLAGSAVLLTDYVLLVPLAYTIGVRYNITNEALIGACFLPCGIGNMIGAPLAGRLSDRVIVKWRQKRGGEWYPEDRLRAAMSGAMFLVPLSILCAGLVTEYVDGKLGLILNLLCLFVNGVGVDVVLSPSASYAVDVVHHRSAEAMAANSGLRSFVISVAVSFVLPLIDKIGVGATNALAAGVAWIGCLILWLTIRYGTQLRAWVDVGYSTVDNN
ncbi:major facilitator superfamily domain-containing protein [Collybia nuda]|uniref:Major facilitator superfamily domain-containing protein n=1 Tax=Collybia nuda TaxID=64659 RepID=A0A9P5Y219_9AGAR|nr:major facilitator superfamily domain-containing protein [Collybia nuda]